MKSFEKLMMIFPYNTLPVGSVQPVLPKSIVLVQVPSTSTVVKVAHVGKILLLAVLDLLDMLCCAEY